MKGRKIALIVLGLSAALMLSLLAGCGKSKYSYTNPPLEDSGWQNLEHDDTIVMDGALNEEAWKGRTAFEFTKTDGDAFGTKMAFRTYFGEKGLFFGVEVTDPDVYYVEGRDFFLNDSVEFYIDPVMDTGSLDYRFLQIRVDALGNAQQWIGVSLIGYEWARTVVPMMTATKVHGTLNPREGESSTGYTLEIFIPWTSLYPQGMQAVPECIGVLPAYVNSRGTSHESTSRQWISVDGIEHTNPLGYLEAYKDGGIVRTDEQPLEEGAKFQNAKGYNLPKNMREDVTEGTVNVFAAAPTQRAYFRDLFNVSGDFYFEAQVSADRFGVDYPKMGILVENLSGTRVEKSIEIYNDGGNAIARCENGTWKNYSFPSSVTDKNSMRIAVTRIGNTFRFYFNDAKVYETTQEGFGNASVGLIAHQSEGVYSGFKYSKDAETVERYANERAAAFAGRGENGALPGQFAETVEKGASVKLSVTEFQNTDWVYYLPLKDYKENFLFRVNIAASEFANSDFPKIGVRVDNAPGNKTLEVYNDGGNSVARCVNGGWSNVNFPDSVKDKDNMEVAVLRNGSEFRFYFDRGLVYQHSDGDFGNASVALIVHRVIGQYTNYNYTTDQSAINDYIGKVNEKAAFSDRNGSNPLPGHFTEVIENGVSQKVQVTDAKPTSRAFYRALIERSGDFKFEVTVKTTTFGSDFPKMGVLVEKDSKKFIEIYNDGGNSIAQCVNGQWQPGVNFPSGVTDKKEMKITVVKRGNTAYFYFNDSYVSKYTTDGWEKCTVALIVHNCKGEYYGYGHTLDAALIDQYMTEHPARS